MCWIAGAGANHVASSGCIVWFPVATVWFEHDTPTSALDSVLGRRIVTSEATVALALVVSFGIRVGGLFWSLRGRDSMSLLSSCHRCWRHFVFVQMQGAVIWPCHEGGVMTVRQIGRSSVGTDWPIIGALVAVGDACLAVTWYRRFRWVSRQKSGCPRVRLLSARAPRILDCFSGGKRAVGRK